MRVKRKTDESNGHIMVLHHKNAKSDRQSPIRLAYTRNTPTNIDARPSRIDISFTRIHGTCSDHAVDANFLLAPGSRSPRLYART